MRPSVPVGAGGEAVIRSPLRLAGRDGAMAPGRKWTTAGRRDLAVAVCRPGPCADGVPAARPGLTGTVAAGLS